MPLSASQCAQFNEYLFRRTPDWDKRLTKDRYPYNYTYAGLYKTGPWDPFTGTTHTYDRVHVTMPNDNGCWDEVSIEACSTTCSPSRAYTGWGSDRLTYSKYHKDYQTPPFCFDQLRDTEDAAAQLDAIVEAHKKMPDMIISDFIRLFTLRSADYIYCAGSALTEVTNSASLYTANCTKINLGSTGNLPTSKLTMEYLQHYQERLMLNGYHNRDYVPAGIFTCMSDLQTQKDICNANPQLMRMYTSADFAKGGQFFKYGVMNANGNWLFKYDPTPLRFQHIGSGVLQRIFPYDNVAATVGKKPKLAAAYLNAPYQMSHVYNPAARTILVGDTTPVNGDMKFLARSLMGQWTWKSPDMFNWTDPNTGVTCTMANDKHNMGYFLGEYELGVKTEYPEIEMNILHLREPQAVVDDARCAAEPSTATQTLSPYNSFCGDP